MSYDGLFTHYMVKELNAALLNGRLSKIHQPYEHEIMLVIRANGKNQTLLLSAHPSYARVQLTDISYKNPLSPPNFCMILRKYLEGSILTKIRQIENDRIIHFSFNSRNELGDIEEIVLIVEIMGRHSNIILLNKQTNKIIDTIKHVGSSQNSYRLLLPGAEYINPPASDKMNPFTLSSDKLFEFVQTHPNLDSTAIINSFQGIGRDTGEEITYRMIQSEKEKIAAWNSFFSELASSLSPTLTNFQNKDYITPVPFINLSGTKQNFQTLSQLLDAFYEGKAERDRVKQQAGELIRKVTNDQQKLKKKIKKLEQSLIDADNADIYRIKGELLTTYLHEVPKGAKEVKLPNYYDEATSLLSISLNKALSPSQNAQKYFQRYQKLKNGVKVVKEQISLARYDLIYLESVSSQLEIANPSDIDMIREELIEEKYIKPKRHEAKKKQKKSKPEEFISSDGVNILVGRNNIQNDQLTLKQAKKTDYWLHAKDIPGSHVIVKTDQPSEQTLLEAAQLAAYFSKYRLSNHVPVDYVQVKHIKKPNGAKPGYVIYENQKTLFVTPSKNIVTKLKF